MKTDVQKETQFAHLGRPTPGLGTPVNPSLTRASTLLFGRAEDLYRSDIRGYGRHGSEVHDRLKEAFNLLEGGADTTLTPSGLSACTIAILSQVKSGDHVLLTDSTYGPIRAFCVNHLKAMGIETEIYDPRIGADIEGLLRPNTTLICLESPGSLTFEVQDVPAICEVARDRNVKTFIDNTWSAGLTLNPLKLGVDISIHAATKYFSGHSDILYGAIVSRTKAIGQQVARTAKYLGNATSPDDTYQILRGFRTVVTRFKQQEASALALAKFLASHGSVQTVQHPALDTHPDHALWKRDFTGGGCIFSVVLTPTSDAKVLDLVNGLHLFGIGYSYGGYESLAIHCDPQLTRKFAPDFGGPVVRFACGLEAAQDLIADVDNALNVLK